MSKFWIKTPIWKPLSVLLTAALTIIAVYLLWRHLGKTVPQADSVVPFLILLVGLGTLGGLSFLWSLMVRPRSGEFYPSDIELENLNLKSELATTDRSLRELKKEMNQTMETSDDLFWSIDENGRWMYLNERATDFIYGYKPSEMIGKNFYDFVHPSNLQSDLKSYDETEKVKDEIWGHQTVHVHKDGSPVHLVFNAIVMRDKNGKRTGVRGCAKDQTQLKKLEKIGRERHELSNNYNKSLLQLAKKHILEFEKFAEVLTKIAAKTLKVEQIGIWFFNSDGSELVLKVQYTNSHNKYSQGISLKASDYPRYFAVVNSDRAIPSDDVQNDPRFSELALGYLIPNGITSMLDVGIRHHGQLTGVLCIESTGPKRQWTLEEQDYVSSLADQLAFCVESIEKRETQSLLKQYQQELFQLKSKLKNDSSPSMDL